VHQDFAVSEQVMEKQKKLYVALTIYAVLGLLIWMTIDNIPLPFSAVHLTLRQLTLGILGVFVLQTLLHWYAGKMREGSAKRFITNRLQ
jgi:hypothetical protein